MANTIEVMTCKSGKFRFSGEYANADIVGSLIRAVVLNETVVDLPILPELSARLEPDIMYSSISGTAMIEGNAIVGEDVKRIAEGEELERYTQKDKQEVKNLIEAYALLSTVEISDSPMELTEEIIKDIHTTITKDVQYDSNVPGKYRNIKVHVGDKDHGGVYTPPKILKDIKDLMSVFIDWINSDEIKSLNPFIRAALAHYHFCLIHPFGDGNGRTARLIEALLLQSANIKYVPKELSNFYYRNVDDYYIAFSKSIKNKGDITPFIEFVLAGAIESLEGIKKSIIYFIRRFSLREYYSFEKRNKNITLRQFELLLLLLDNPTDFTLKDLFEKRPFSLLYNTVSTQTARRDLKKLESKNIIKSAEDNKYCLNYETLG